MTGFKINERLPSLNEYIRECRGNKYGSAKFKRDVERKIMLSARDMPEITAPCVVHFTWFERTKRRDKDNVAFAKKFILDALQKSGKLPNDNNRYVLGFTDEFVYGEGDGVEVMVEVEPVGIADKLSKQELIDRFKEFQ